MLRLQPAAHATSMRHHIQLLHMSMPRTRSSVLQRHLHCSSHQPVLPSFQHPSGAAAAHLRSLAGSFVDEALPFLL
jgi:hypothetical protein